MKRFIDDIEEQVEKCLLNNGIPEIKEKYKVEINKIFNYLYILNFLSNRIELRENFKSKYFNITISCLIEAFELLINNYTRGSSLVLRSALENFMKHIIHFYIKNNENCNLEINDRSYNANKITLDKISDNYIREEFTEISKSINSKMEAEYKKLSGLSHSLVTESEINTLEYFEDLKRVSDQNVSLVIQHFNEAIYCIFSFGIIINEKSFKHWDTGELCNIMGVVFGRKQTNSYLKKLKC